MKTNVIKTDLKTIESLRNQFLHENHFQFIYDKCHRYRWADTYVFTVDDAIAGYGAVWGAEKREDRDAIFEFYTLPAWRKHSPILFSTLCEVSQALIVECQSNDALLSEMLFQHTKNIFAESFLFEDHFQTNIGWAETLLEKKIMGADSHPDDREYILRHQNEIVATGGFFLNYNYPYADLYYDVVEKHRRKGLGSYMVQLLKQEAYLMGRVPAARCHIKNTISKATLLKAGFHVCGFILKGQITK